MITAHAITDTLGDFRTAYRTMARLVAQVRDASNTREDALEKDELEAPETMLGFAHPTDLAAVERVFGFLADLHVLATRSATIGTSVYADLCAIHGVHDPLSEIGRARNVLRVAMGDVRGKEVDDEC